VVVDEVVFYHWRITHISPSFDLDGKRVMFAPKPYSYGSYEDLLLYVEGLPTKKFYNREPNAFYNAETEPNSEFAYIIFQHQKEWYVLWIIDSSSLHPSPTSLKHTVTPRSLKSTGISLLKPMEFITDAQWYRLTGT